MARESKLKENIEQLIGMLGTQLSVMGQHDTGRHKPVSAAALRKRHFGVEARHQVSKYNKKIKLRANDTI